MEPQTPNTKPAEPASMAEPSGGPNPDTSDPATDLLSDSRPAAPTSSPEPSGLGRRPDPLLDELAGPTTAPLFGPVVGGQATSSTKLSIGKPKRRWKLLAGLTTGLVLLLGGGAAAYFGYYVPNQPQNILKAALVNSFSSLAPNSSAFEGELNVKPGAGAPTIGATFSGKAGSDGALEFKSEVDVLVSKLTLELRSVDGKSYFVKAGGLDSLSQLATAMGDDSLAEYGSLLSMLDNQWFEINESLVKEAAGTDSLTLSPADMRKLGDILAKHMFMKVSQTMPDEKIKGTDSYHYKVLIDEAELKAALAELKAANIKALKLTAEDLVNFNTLLDQVDLSKYPLEIWIEKDKKLVDQIGLSLTLYGADIDFRFTVFNHGLPVEVEKPAGAKSILEMLGAFMGGVSGSSSGGTTESLILDELQSSGISL